MGAVSSITNSFSDAIGTSGGGGGLLDSVSEVLGTDGSADNGLSGIINNVGGEVANSPLGQAALSAALATVGVPPAVTAALLGANQTSQNGGDIGAGLQSALLSYGAGQIPGMFEGAGAAAGSGAALPMDQVAAMNAGTTATSNVIPSVMGGGVMGILGDIGTSSAGGAIGSALSGLSPGLVGAALGALGSSGSTTTSTSGSKDPWGPAQGWMRSNIANGQALQAKYAANPFSAFQKQAYNNSAQLGNQYRTNMNQMIPQMNAYRPYQRTPQSQTVQPRQFAQTDLGITNNPFGA
jgi:hypothetical protein